MVVEGLDGLCHLQQAADLHRQDFGQDVSELVLVMYLAPLLGLASDKLQVQTCVVKQHGVLQLEPSVWVCVAFGYAVLGFVESACAGRHA